MGPSEASASRSEPSTRAVRFGPTPSHRRASAARCKHSNRSSVNGGSRGRARASANRGVQLDYWASQTSRNIPGVGIRTEYQLKANTSRCSSLGDRSSATTTACPGRPDCSLTTIALRAGSWLAKDLRGPTLQKVFATAVILVAVIHVHRSPSSPRASPEEIPFDPYLRESAGGMHFMHGGWINCP